MTPPLSLDHFTLVYINYLTVSNVKLSISQALFPLRSGYGSLRDNPECLRGPGPERGAIYPLFPSIGQGSPASAKALQARVLVTDIFLSLPDSAFFSTSSIERGSFS